VAARESARRERIWDGVIEAVNQATLSAQTGGRVLELPFDVDDYVPAGAVVARFTDVEQQSAQRRAQAALAAAESTARAAEADYERIREIHARKLVAKAQLDQATARRDGARAALDSARAALRESAEQVDYTVIRAPYSGILTQRHVQVGETVRPGQALISGISLGELRVEVQVPQSDVVAIRQHRQAAVILDALKGERLEAREVVVFPNADPLTHSFRVRLELPTRETGLHPGMTVKVAFTVGEAQRLLVPASALLQRSEVRAVYVLDAQGVALRQVRTGHRYGERIEILTGLAEGERIAADPVAAGQWLAKSRAGARRDG
jgi:RND family efflux transporter MFP subunit